MDTEINTRLTHLLNFSQKVADFLREKQVGRNLDVKKKGSIDLVTEADLHSEKLLIQEIQKEFPKDQILGEETGLLENSGKYKWIIDPLDGTTNYANFLPLYAISIALENAEESQVVAGIVVLPALRETYHAIRGNGAYKNKQPIQVSNKSDFVDSLFCTGFPYNLNENLERLTKTFSHMLSLARGIRRTGSAALDLAWLAEGRFDGVWEENLKPWDTAAGQVLIEEAGGVVTDFAGNPFLLNAPHIAAGNPEIHKCLIKELKEFAN